MLRRKFSGLDHGEKQDLYEDFREVLLHWLTVVLVACLMVKIAVAITAFVLGLRRNAATARAVAWIAGGWLACGFFVAGFAGHVCSGIHNPDAWIWVALGGFRVAVTIYWRRTDSTDAYPCLPEFVQLLAARFPRTEDCQCAEIFSRSFSNRVSAALHRK